MRGPGHPTPRRDKRTLAGVEGGFPCWAWDALIGSAQVCLLLAFILAVFSSWWWLALLPVVASGEAALNYLRHSCP